MKKRPLPKIVFALSLVTPVFWGLGMQMDVYRFAVVGAIFELLWLPMIGSVYGLPLLCLLLWIKEKWSLKSLYFYSLLIATTSLVYILSL